MEPTRHSIFHSQKKGAGRNDAESQSGAKDTIQIAKEDVRAVAGKQPGALKEKRWQRGQESQSGASAGRKDTEVNRARRKRFRNLRKTSEKLQEATWRIDWSPQRNGGGSGNGQSLQG